MAGRPPPEIAEDILRYFLRNPRAADDLEGIARWRLAEVTIDRSVEETNHCLQWLVERGFLLKVSLAGSGEIFRLNPEERASAKSFLALLERKKSVD